MMSKAVSALVVLALVGQSAAQCPPPANCDHCNATVDMVCGVSGMSYDNECLAECAGEWSTPGACPQAWDTTVPGDWNYFRGNTLQPYWQGLASDFGLDHCRLGYKPLEGQWYIDGNPACVGFGDFDQDCNFDKYSCIGNNQSYGFGAQQIAALEDIISNNRTVDPMCPLCPPMPGFVVVCHDGKKYAFEEPPENSHDFGTPGAMAMGGRGTWLTCDCDEVHRGFPLPEGSYYWNLAIAAGLNPAEVTHFSGVWYYQGRYTCVGRGGFDQECPDLELLCAGSNAMTYGYGSEQLMAVADAAALPSGEHEYCPLP